MDRARVCSPYHIDPSYESIEIPDWLFSNSNMKLKKWEKNYLDQIWWVFDNLDKSGEEFLYVVEWCQSEFSYTAGTRLI